MKTQWKPHDWVAVCEVCGFKYPASKLKERWDGLRVCKDDWEPRHPLDSARPKVKETPVLWTSPDDAELSYEEVGDASKTLVVGTNSPDQHFSSDLTANRTITLSLTNAREGASFSIWKKVTTDGFTVDVGGLHTISANKGGTVTVIYSGTSWYVSRYTEY